MSDMQIYTWLCPLFSSFRVSMVIMRGTMVCLESPAHLDHRYTISCTWEPWPSFYSRSSDSCSPVFCLPGPTWYCRSSCEYSRVCTALCNFLGNVYTQTWLLWCILYINHCHLNKSNCFVLISRVSQVYQAPMEPKDQRDQEDLLGYQVWMDSLDSR